MRVLLSILTLLVLAAPAAAEDFWRQVNPPNATVVLAVNADGNVFAGGAGVSRSTDAGETWVEASAGLPSSTIVQVLGVDPEGRLFAGTTDGLYRSTDNGDSWVRASAGLPAIPSVWGLTFAPGGQIFAVTSGKGIYRSTDNGDSWVSVNRGLPKKQCGPSIAAVGGGHLLATAAGAVYRSTDNGERWRRIAKFDRVILSIAVSPDGRIFLGTAGRGVFSSSDNGATWTAHRKGLGDPTVMALAPGMQPGALFAGTRARGVFRSMDAGEHWSELNAGIPDARTVDSLAVTSAGYVFASTSRGVFRSVSPTGGVEPILLVDEIDPELYPRDGYAVQEADITGDVLRLKVTAGGGCSDHEFKFVASRTFMESFPVQASVLLSHDANDDPCDSIIVRELFFDLSPLKRAYQQGYQTEHGTIVLRLPADRDISIEYRF